MEGPLIPEPTDGQLLQLVMDYAARIAETGELDDLLNLIADLGKGLVSCDRCTLWMLDRRAGQAWTRVAHGSPRMSMPMKKGLVGAAIAEGDSIIVNDPYSDPRFNSEFDKTSGYRTHSILVVPIFDNHSEVMAVYQAINKMSRADGFQREDVARLRMAASYSGSSLQRAALSLEVRETQDELVHMLGEVCESRSKETGEHVKRVGLFAMTLGEELGFTESECGLLLRSAPLHDTGKVGIPDAILNKPGKLTDEEFEIMKTHAFKGQEVLEKSQRRILSAGAVIAGEHHEKWNGLGYPYGKKGEDIHIYARITAIADVFDALMHRRCYKSAWGLAEVLDLFQKERFQQFDGGLVDMMVRRIGTFEQILLDHPDIDDLAPSAGT
jgi:response regulator RpfG family c-di-GMP phosphodiesterase